MPASVKAMLRARHGGGGGGGGGGRTGRFHRARRAAGHFGADLKKKASPLAILLFGIAGYLSGNALTNTGLPQALYNASSARGGKWATFVNAGWNANGGSSNSSNPFSGGGVQFLIKTAAFLLGGYGVYKSRHGTVSGSTLNVILPLAVGMGLDPPSTNVDQSRSTAVSIGSGRFG